MKKDIATIIIGLLFLAAGVAIGGTLLGLFDLSLTFDGWWTVFIIVPALIAMVRSGINLGNLIVLAVGVILLLDAQRVFPQHLSWRFILPVVLCIVGVRLLFGGSGFACCSGKRAGKAGGQPGGASPRPGEGPGTASASSGDSSYKTASVLFGGQEIGYGTGNFSGATYSAVFGGLTINLHDVILTGDVVITATALFGGIELVLPDNVQLVCNVSPTLGGTEIKTPPSRDPNAPKVIVNGSVTFGSIEIR